MKLEDFQVVSKNIVFLFLSTESTRVPCIRKKLQTYKTLTIESIKIYTVRSKNLYYKK